MPRRGSQGVARPETPERQPQKGITDNSGVLSFPRRNQSVVHPEAPKAGPKTVTKDRRPEKYQQEFEGDRRPGQSCLETCAGPRPLKWSIRTQPTKKLTVRRPLSPCRKKGGSCIRLLPSSGLMHHTLLACRRRQTAPPPPTRLRDSLHGARGPVAAAFLRQRPCVIPAIAPDTPLEYAETSERCSPWQGTRTPPYLLMHPVDSWTNAVSVRLTTFLRSAWHKETMGNEATSACAASVGWCRRR